MSDQHSETMMALGRIEQKIDSHREETIVVNARFDRELNELDVRQGTTEKSLTKMRGWGAGVGSVLTGILALIGLDQFWS